VVDLRPGRSYRLALQPAAGDAFIVRGTHRELEPPERLVYTRRWETGPAADGSDPLLSVEFNARGDQIELVLAHTDFPAGHAPTPTRWGGRATSTSSKPVPGSGVDA
jgi:uncharacterized protein YndB with AHSA1/START domain